jgi:hypothetical protein
MVLRGILDKLLAWETIRRPSTVMRCNGEETMRELVALAFVEC